MGLRKKDESQIVLGEKYRDTITGFTGVAVARHEYIHGCTRVSLHAMEGGDIKEFSFDAPALVAVKDEQEYTSKKTGGPGISPKARPTK